ncbi:hypothetical protein BXZ70DRAFT_461426 [Cristinia sonorae]|uniref:Uncharacterized protein n=1 Tax=Cristinia sonorae TaxID=1940300 RepID=A0A8K0UHG6_9AGAR|nr:hypothetical protein BXZ70DRAFT_461426 [Cristinia sonorae]
MSVTNSLQRFFAEQEDRMNVADEEIDSYLSRIASANRTRANRGPSVRTSPVSDYGGITPQPYEYDREKQGISNETSDSVEYLETTISALHAGISSVMEGPEPNASVSCTKRKMSDPTSESRPEKKSRADHDEPLHISAIDETAVSAASNGRQSRAESSLASKQQGRISPHPGRPAMDGPVDKELGRSKGTSQVGLAAAVSVSNGDDADTTKQRVSHGSLSRFFSHARHCH